MSYTLPPKYQRYTNRLRALIAEGNEVVKLAIKGDYGNAVMGHDSIQLRAWVAKTENIILTVFGKEGAHYNQYFIKTKNTGVEYDYEIRAVLGILSGALDDLENGFLLNQEFLVASDVFDSVLEQAKHLLGAGYKDPSAVLGRVVIEDSLKRLARANGVNDSQKASGINDDLKKANIYNQPQWRQIQAWLDIGNDAAHGNFNNFSDDDVKRMLEGIEAFLATYLSIV